MIQTVNYIAVVVVEHIVRALAKGLVDMRVHPFVQIIVRADVMVVVQGNNVVNKTI